MTGYLAGLVGSTTPGGVAAAAIATAFIYLIQRKGREWTESRRKGRGTVACYRVRSDKMFTLPDDALAGVKKNEM